MSRYLYLDETDYSKATPHIGYGAMATDTLLEDATIIKAMESLKKDPDRLIEPRKSQDDKTIGSGYFHASEDSGNAHSHICDAINADLMGVFSSDFSNYKKTKEKEGLYKLLAQLNSLRALESRDKVEFFLEQREDLSEKKLRRWFAEHENNILMSIYNLPWMPTYFPDIGFHIVDKNNSGTQCVDFILWAVNRHIADRDDTWINRIKTISRSEIKEKWKGLDLIFKKELLEPTSFYSIKDFPQSPGRINNELLGKFYIMAESLIHFYANKEPIENIAHLGEEIRRISGERLDLQKKDHVVEMAGIFLKLFD